MKDGKSVTNYSTADDKMTTLTNACNHYLGLFINRPHPTWHYIFQMPHPLIQSRCNNGFGLSALLLGIIYHCWNYNWSVIGLPTIEKGTCPWRKLLLTATLAEVKKMLHIRTQTSTNFFCWSLWHLFLMSLLTLCQHNMPIRITRLQSSLNHTKSILSFSDKLAWNCD